MRTEPLLPEFVLPEPKFPERWLAEQPPRVAVPEAPESVVPEPAPEPEPESQAVEPEVAADVLVEAETSAPITDAEPDDAPWDWTPEPETPEPVPGPETVQPAVVRSLDAIWAWSPDPVPDTGSADAGSATEHDPDDPSVVRSVDAIWSWVPDHAVVAPPEPPVVVEPPVVPAVDGPPVVRSRPVQARRRRGKAKAEAAEVHVAESDVADSAGAAFLLPPPLVPVPVKGRRRTNGSRRAPVPAWREIAAEPSAPPAGRRRLVRTGAIVAAVGLCAALPWVAPQIPDLFAKAVPEKSSTPTNPDPTIDPATPLPEASVTPDPTLAGKLLASAGKPLEVSVPRLHVRSGVVPISGQTGELIPPDDPQILGWWQEGREAGAAQGSVVVTGHTVSTGGGAFDHLGELVRGDRIKVRTSAGTIVYVVQESRDVPVAKLARTAKEIFRQTGDGRLVLITCSDFNGEVYLGNSVVYATPVKDEPTTKDRPGAQLPRLTRGQHHLLDDAS